MKTSRRARRMQRQHALMKTPGLNLVSLMDIFTILVFFLLVNSGSPQNLPNLKDLRMPAISRLQPPADSSVLAVTQDRLLLNGEALGAWQDWQNPGNPLLGRVKEALVKLNPPAAGDPASGDGGKPITLMADEAVPYALIEALVAICQDADFRQVAFAANLKARATGAP